MRKNFLKLLIPALLTVIAISGCKNSNSSDTIPNAIFSGTYQYYENMGYGLYRKFTLKTTIGSNYQFIRDGMGYHDNVYMGTFTVIGNYIYGIGALNSHVFEGITYDNGQSWIIDLMTDNGDFGNITFEKVLE